MKEILLFQNHYETSMIEKQNTFTFCVAFGYRSILCNSKIRGSVKKTLSDASESVQQGQTYNGLYDIS